MKIKPFIHIVDIDLFKRSVVILCGSVEEIERIIGRPSSFYPKKLVGNMKAAWPLVKDGIDRDMEESCSTTTGICLICKDDVYVWMPEWRSDVFVHETFHAVSAMKRITGFDDEETGAYLMEYLFHSVCWSLEDPKCPSAKRR